MKNNNLITNSEINNMFISAILLLCGFELDKNINYKTILNNTIVTKYLENKIDHKIIKYINKNIDFTGKVIYLRNNADTECMIYYNKTICYLVFIGTQLNFKDIWTDICLGLKSIDFLNHKIKIHSKYIDNMNCDNLLNKIKKIIDQLEFNEINICGHSMGCGVGFYTSLVLSHKFKDKKFNLITLDAPKIGNQELNNYIKKIKNLSQIDLINNKDIAPLFPFIYPKYFHISTKTCITDNYGDITICKKPNKLNIFTNHSIKDHSLYNIIHNLYFVLKKEL